MQTGNNSGDRGEAADRTERLRQWFAVQAPPVDEVAAVLAEADAVSQETIAYSQLIVAEAAVLAGTAVPGKPAAAPVPDVELDDLQQAAQIVADMCQELLAGDELSDAQRKTIETVYETAKDHPGMIQQAIDDDTDASSDTGNNGDTDNTDEAGESGSSSSGTAGGSGLTGGASTLP